MHHCITAAPIPVSVPIPIPFPFPFPIPIPERGPPFANRTIKGRWTHPTGWFIYRAPRPRPSMSLLFIIYTVIATYYDNPCMESKPQHAGTAQQCAFATTCGSGLAGLSTWMAFVRMESIRRYTYGSLGTATMMEFIPGLLCNRNIIK